MDTLSNTIQTIYIKLGFNCNFNCKYCHSTYTDVKFNPNILPIINSLKNLREIRFGGGEPILYLDTIKSIVEYLGPNIQYKMVTNGSLLTQEIVDFCNKYNFIVPISVDGDNSTRDTNIPIKWDLVRQLNNTGFVLTVYSENQNLEETLNSLAEYKRKYLKTNSTKLSFFPNFVHSINQICSNKELADSYISQMITLLKEAIEKYTISGKVSFFLRSCFENFYEVKDFNGIHCCNNKYIQILANGDICCCTYSLDKVGDIFHLDDLNIDKIKDDNMKPECHTCEIFNICKNHCCKNITDNECYIMKQMNKNISEIINKM